ncbi:MAG TPA: PIG-L family deacetylase [Terriglobales bacterium]|nr:PIG-L family deacetylase [Terriglobales bacterium]
MDELRQLLGHTLVLVAHPDDEVIGCGALLDRMRSSTVVFATDGAPRDIFFWQAYGSRQAYAEIRRKEALQVAELASVSRVKFLSDSHDNMFVDQELFRNLAAAIDELRAIVQDTQPGCLLTLAYEGGHPDHDCCSFMTSVLAYEFRLPAWEMPLYHRAPDLETRRQQFMAERGHEFVYNLTAPEQAKKQSLLDLYRSQHAVLQDFKISEERFRLLPVYDYSHPPHPAPLNYEMWGWPVNGREVSTAFCRYLEQSRNRKQARVS